MVGGPTISNVNSETLKIAKYIDITRVKEDLNPSRISIN